MNDIVNNLELIPINSVPLSESGVGENINDRFSNIDRNFQTIINSEYLKGQTGDGIYAKECLFEKNSNEGLGIYKGDQLQELTSGELYELISDCILTEVEVSQSLDETPRIPKGEIVLIYQNNGDKNILISSLPYVFIDKVYLSSLREENKPNPNKDLSCILYFENDNFIKSSTIPKIYYDEDVEAFCWNINGVPTQLPAQGPKGDIGESGESIYYARCKYEKPTNENVEYIITEIYDAKKNDYTEAFLITNGSIIVSEVTNAPKNIPSVIIGVYNEKKDNEEKVVKYIDQSIGLDIPDISTLMKGNPSKALYVDTGYEDKESPNQKIYHSIYSYIGGENEPLSLKMGLIDENSQLISDKSNQFISGYSNNIFERNIEVRGELSLSELNKPLIQNNQNKIKITVGGQTSDEFTVPFATNATNTTYIGSKDNIKGKRNQPVYISNGQPSAIDISEGSGVDARPLLVINNDSEIYKTNPDKISVTYDTGTLTARQFMGKFQGDPDTLKRFIGNLQGNADTATTAVNLKNKPFLSSDDDKQIQITAGGLISDAFTVPFANYSGYSINPIVVSAEDTKWQNRTLQINKINYVWVANGESSEDIKLNIELPQLTDTESYVRIPDSLNQYVGICQCVLLVDARINLSVAWRSAGCKVQYSMESSLLGSSPLDSSESGIKEIIFTGYWYWDQINKQKNVVWVVGGNIYLLNSVS